MDALFSYLKRNYRLAWQSVRYHFRQYLCFFAAVFIVQVFFGLLLFSGDTNDRQEYLLVSDEYDYHLVLRGLTETQYLTLMNSADHTLFSQSRPFSYVRTEQRSEAGTDEVLYDVYILFSGDIPEAYHYFEVKYFKSLADLSPQGLFYEESELLNFEKNLSHNHRTEVFSVLLLSLISVFLLTSLCRIRNNHYKFEYGIYMTFGADFRRLFGTFFHEMTVITLLTFLPAAGTAAALVAIIHAARGTVFCISFGSCAVILGISLAVCALSVLLPALRLSRQTPMANIIAGDNSNLVTSPRVSFEMLGASFPRKYELFTLWRFRKYVLPLAVTACVFSALFVSSVYLSDYVGLSENASSPQFRIKMDYSDVYEDALLSIPGVTGVEKDVPAASADELTTFLLVSGSDVAPFSNFVQTTDPETGDTARATLSVCYSPCDEKVTRQLEEYSHTGDLSSVLTEEHTVIISDSFKNTKKLNISPGDTIRIGVFVKANRAPDTVESGNGLLSSWLDSYEFRYLTYTVGAVLTGNPTGSELPVYFSESDYQELTGQTVVWSSVSVYADPLIPKQDADQLETELRSWASLTGTYTLSNTHASENHQIAVSRCYTALIPTLGALILAVLPLLWFFSQSLFNRKRAKEFTLLQSLGGQENQLLRLRAVDGAVFAALSALLCFLFSAAGVFALYRLFATVIGFTGFSGRLIFRLPYLPLAGAVLFSAACGFAAAFLPLPPKKQKTAKDTHPELFRDDAE